MKNQDVCIIRVYKNPLAEDKGIRTVQIGKLIIHSSPGVSWSIDNSAALKCSIISKLKEIFMPWTGKEFASKHNKSLHGKDATKAAKQATAMVRAGVPEGEAIATANKNAKHTPKKK